MTQPPPMTVFPLHDIVFSDNGSPPRCACRNAKCTQVGAHPLIKFSQLEPGQSVHAPSGRYGLRTGGKFGLIVIDVDRKNGKDGLPKWLEIQSALGIPNTRVIQTPSGGYHYLYRVPVNSRISNSVSRIGDGIDVRGDNGFVVHEGTIGKNGKIYTCIYDVAPVDAPQTLLDLLAANDAIAKVRPEGNQPDGVPWDDVEMARRRASFRVDCATMPPSIEGQGGDMALWTIALRGARGYALPQNAVYEDLIEIFNLRCVPPWDPEIIKRKCEQARHNATTPLDTVYDTPEAYAEIMTPIIKAREAAEEAEREAKRPKALPIKHGATRNIRVRQPDEKWQYAFEAGMLDEMKPARSASVLEIVGILNRNPIWEGVFQYDDFQKKICAVKPPTRLDCENPSHGLTQADIISVQCWFLSQGLKASKGTIEDAIIRVANDSHGDSLMSWAENLPSMSEEEARATLRELAFRGFGARHSIGAETFVTRHMVGAIGRALVPGRKHDHVLILAGEKDMRKTSTLAELFRPEWFRAQMPRLNERDGSHALAGFFGVSFDEMGAMLKDEAAVIKDFITRPEDDYRDYGTRDKIKAKRRCVFFGTTNPNSSLIKDPDTDRRWLILQVTERCDSDWVRQNQAKIWSAAKTLYTLGERSWLDKEESLKFLELSQADYIERSESEADVTAYIEARSPEEIAKGLSLRDIYTFVYGGIQTPEELRRAFESDYKLRRDLGATMRRIGWKSKSFRVGKAVVSRWVPR